MASGKFRPGPFSRIVRGIIENLTRGKGPQGGVQVGTDPFGNRYFEIPADPSRGKRRPIRWYDAPNTNQKEIFGVDIAGGFDAKLPAEWESWLRMRRDDPPTFEQVMESLALADLKKRNAAKLDAKNQEQLLEMGREVPGEIKPQEGEKPFWPKYEEYDEGDKLREHREGKDRWSDFKNPYATKDQGQSK